MKEKIWFTNIKYLRISTLHGHYTYVCSVSKVIGVKMENKIYLPNKEYISVHLSQRINMVVKHIVYMHTTVELRAGC